MICLTGSCLQTVSVWSEEKNRLWKCCVPQPSHASLPTKNGIFSDLTWILRCVTVPLSCGRSAAKVCILSTSCFSRKSSRKVLTAVRNSGKNIFRTCSHILNVSETALRNRKSPLRERSQRKRITNSVSTCTLWIGTAVTPPPEPSMP